MNDVAREIEDLERRGWEALSGREGEAFYTDAMAEEGLMIFPGTVMDRRDALRAIAEAPPWSTFELSELRVASTADTAVVTYEASAQRVGEPPYHATMSSVYVRRDGKWRLVLHQQSPH
jgi:uncharacterized protein (TIGR02246 family)